MDAGKFHNPRVNLHAIGFGKHREPENPILKGFAKGAVWIYRVHLDRRISRPRGIHILFAWWGSSINRAVLTVLAPVIRIPVGPGLLCTQLVVPIVRVGFELILLPFPTALFLAAGL